MVGNNWAHNVSFSSSQVATPTSGDEIASLIREHDRVGVVGAGHSFNSIADTTGVLVTTERMRRVLEIDPNEMTVTIEGGARYNEVCDILHAVGFALPNLMSIPHFSVVGACATGTHGSGDSNRCLASAIGEVEFVNGAGESATVRRGDADFGGVPIGLGALGIVTQLVLDIVPTFDMAQEVLLDLPLRTAIDSFDEIMASAYSVSMFTDWQGDTVNQLWRKHRCDAGTATPVPTSYAGAKPSTAALLPTGDAGGQHVTPQLLINGPWHQRLPHIAPSHHLEPAGELQSEYFVSRDHAQDALEAIAALQTTLAPAIRMSEIRTVAGDRGTSDDENGLWLSPFRGPTVALHFSWHIDGNLGPVLPAVELALAPFEPLPHWGKLHAMPSTEVTASSSRFTEFAALVERHDPEHKFRNTYLNNLLGEQAG
jgi:alditol oxidase